MKILLVEDDMALSMGIKYSLENEGYIVESANSYQSGIEWMNNYITTRTRNKIHGIKNEQENILGLFDVMLPDGNGFALLSEFKEHNIDIPVIFLTALSDEINVVQGLELGADDYISKPFRVKELMSRIKAVSRRYEKQSNKNEKTVVDNKNIRYRDIEIDIRKAEVYKIVSEDKELLELTQNEYKLLIYFINNQGIVLNRNTILEKLFDSRGNFIDDNTLSVYIKRLREKIGDTDKDNPYIKTVRGVGYMMEKDNA